MQLLEKKPCCRCGEVKPLDAFPFRRRGQSARYPRCRRCHSEVCAQFRKTNRDRVIGWQRRYIEKVKASGVVHRRVLTEAQRFRVNERTREREAADPNFKLKRRLVSRLRLAIRQNRGLKRTRTPILLGVSVVFVRGHLEKSFLPGMTWANYGTVWHIDHHVPCAAWDLTNQHHQLACFNWRNLRPLLAADNIRKRDGFPPDWRLWMGFLLAVSKPTRD